MVTYLEKPEDAVTLNVHFATLADGTSYTAQTALEAKAKNIRVRRRSRGERYVPGPASGIECRRPVQEFLFLLGSRAHVISRGSAAQSENDYDNENAGDGGCGAGGDGWLCPDRQS